MTEHFGRPEKLQLSEVRIEIHKILVTAFEFFLFLAGLGLSILLSILFLVIMYFGITKLIEQILGL